MRFVIVTGMSGSGKSSVMKILEDDGYFCVDNLPLSLLPTLIQLTEDSSEEIERVALGIDIRGGYRSLKEAAHVLDDLKSRGYTLEILFLEASTSVLVKRYKETRRMHHEDFCNFYLTFVSFGFKYGIPSDADLVFDVRFLPNPFYVDELKPLTGDDKPVYDYVMSSPKAVEFRNKMKDMLDFLIPNYIAEGKTQLVIAIGCTGGKHRSVTLTNAMYEEYANTEYGCKKEHRDIEKDRLRYICRSQEK